MTVELSRLLHCRGGPQIVSTVHKNICSNCNVQICGLPAAVSGNIHPVTTSAASWSPKAPSRSAKTYASSAVCTAVDDWVIPRHVKTAVTTWQCTPVRHGAAHHACRRIEQLQVEPANCGEQHIKTLSRLKQHLGLLNGLPKHKLARRVTSATRCISPRCQRPGHQQLQRQTTG